MVQHCPKNTTNKSILAQRPTIRLGCNCTNTVLPLCNVTLPLCTENLALLFADSVIADSDTTSSHITRKLYHTQKRHPFFAWRILVTGGQRTMAGLLGRFDGREQDRGLVRLGTEALLQASVEKFGRRGTEPNELFRSEFGRNSWN